jgi:hypothetical protein
MQTGQQRAGCVALELTIRLAAAAVMAVAPGVASAGAPRAVVVLPWDATVVERFAAEELRRCLTAASDWQVRVSRATPKVQGVLIFWVGTVETPSRLAPAPAAVAAAKTAALVDDGVYLHSQGDAVTLVGKGRRGALNAVYTFLERCVGFHWPEPGQEFVPGTGFTRPVGLDSLSTPPSPTGASPSMGAAGRSGSRRSSTGSPRTG